MGLKKKCTHTILVQTWEASDHNSFALHNSCLNTYNCVYDESAAFFVLIRSPNNWV